MPNRSSISHWKVSHTSLNYIKKLGTRNSGGNMKFSVEVVYDALAPIKNVVAVAK
jgi:hypothetical protein